MAVLDRDRVKYLKDMFRQQIDCSWEKSITSGINQDIKRAPVSFSQGYIEDRPKRVRQLLDAAVPIMEKFHLFFDLSNYVMALADENAVIIAGTGNDRWKEIAPRCGFDIGTSCNEKHIGTNAIGTCCATGEPVCVIGEENYVKQWQDSANAASVIRDPFTREIIGVVCLTCFLRDFHIFALGIVQAIADVIEEKLSHTQAPERGKDRSLERSIPTGLSALKKNLVVTGYHEDPDSLKGTLTRPEFVFASDVIGTLLKKATRAARYDSTKLILGESGVGKEVLARFIHEKGPRRAHPFLAINCAAIPPHLLASELFGYETGAFTGAKRGGSPGRFEQATGGTIYLDEISEMGMELQACLLRVIEDKTVTPLGGGRPQRIDVQIIASSNRDLNEMIHEKRFRSDLYHRLNVISFHIPPLKERREDIPNLVKHFLKKMADKHKEASKEVSDRAMETLLNYDWPGNVRELENAIEMVCILAEGPVIDVTDLKAEIACRLHGQPEEHKDLSHILTVIRENRGNLSRAARSLGMARSTLYRKFAQYNISRESL